MLDAILRIAKLVRSVPIVDEGRLPTPDFLRNYNDNLENTKNMVNAQAEMLAMLAQQQEDITFALEQAGIAVQTAEEYAASQSLAVSYTDPGAILTAQVSGGGTDCEIIIANHTRRYGDSTSVAVTGATLSALLPSTVYYVFYEDAGREGGAVEYHITSDYLEAAQIGIVHSCGSILTPALGGDPTTGDGPYPPGGGKFPDYEIPA